MRCSARAHTGKRRRKPPSARATSWPSSISIVTPDVLADELSYGEQRRLEIAIALAAEPTLLLLDEPAAGMNPEEGQRLVAMIRQIRDRGVTVLLVEHHMRVVMSVCHRVIVIDHGVKIAEGAPEAIARHPEVIRRLSRPGGGRCLRSPTCMCGSAAARCCTA